MMGHGRSETDRPSVQRGRVLPERSPVLSAMGSLLGALLTLGAGSAFAQLTSSNSNAGVNAIAPPQPTVGDAAMLPYAEYEKKVRAAEQVTPLASDLFGDTVSPYLGQTEFNQVDIDLPGNSALPVQLRRRFAVSAVAEGALRDPNGGIGNPYGGAGNWDVDVPYVYGVFDFQHKWDTPNGISTAVPRCTTPFIPGTQSGFSTSEV